jgi:ankyrin repeat protein
MHKQEKLAAFLMREGAPLNVRDKEGHAPLHEAVKSRDLSMVDLLLDHGADPNMTDARGWTILDHLARHDDRSSPVVQRLLVAGGHYQKQLPAEPRAQGHVQVSGQRKEPAKPPPAVLPPSQLSPTAPPPSAPHKPPHKQPPGPFGRKF